MLLFAHCPRKNTNFGKSVVNLKQNNKKNTLKMLKLTFENTEIEYILLHIHVHKLH